jgi:hypothetical protein
MIDEDDFWSNWWDETLTGETEVLGENLPRRCHQLYTPAILHPEKELFVQQLNGSQMWSTCCCEEEKYLCPFRKSNSDPAVYRPMS